MYFTFEKYGVNCEQGDADDDDKDDDGVGK